MVGFRLALWYGGNIGGWVSPEVFQTFIVLAIFVSAVLLQGVVQDYKESEKLICEIFSSFHDLLECMDIADIEYKFDKFLLMSDTHLDSCGSGPSEV